MEHAAAALSSAVCYMLELELELPLLLHVSCSDGSSSSGRGHFVAVVTSTWVINRVSDLGGRTTVVIMIEVAAG